MNLTGHNTKFYYNYKTNLLKKRRNAGKCEHIPGLLFSGSARSGRAGRLRMDGRFP
ncbi:hypothetical protein HMPREF1545_01195 [Oscillibacter sp. KLE 1728]|nr:hypothetical protein HMPREF1545_01195 [Oscillibacter sp. KLE 1728]ERK64120.1 hypothetical protein HMPREF1546_01873 [Oscillibacter sp. KLE 1745]